MEAVMGEDELRGVLKELRGLQLETRGLQLEAVKTTTEIHGQLKALDERQDRFEANLDGALASIRDNAQQINTVKQHQGFHQSELQRQGKRVSELVKKVSVVEGTGQIHVARVTQTWRTVAIAAAALAGFAALIIALLK